MALVVGKLGFGKDAFFYGLELCLARASRVAYPVTPATAAGCDVLLVTLYWWRDILLLEHFLRSSGLRKGGRPYLLAGGMQATMVPRVLGRMVDAVFVGDADDHLGGILDQLERNQQPESPYLYRDGDEALPEPAVCAPSAFAQRTRDGGTTRIEIARGCKFRCAFCAISSLKPYQEVPFEDLKGLLDTLPPGRCSLFAPERTYHSAWKQIKACVGAENIVRGDKERVGRARGKALWRDLGSDVRLERLGEIDGWGASIGLEGISHRLRKSIGKPFTDRFIVERIGAFVSSRPNIAKVTTYFIADLPGEADEDWAALVALFEAIEAEPWSRHLTLCPTLNPLSPKPFTRLRDAVIHPFRDYATRWQAFQRGMTRQPVKRWGFRIAESIVWGPYDRIVDTIITRGGSQAYEIVHALPPALLVSRPPSTESEAVGRRLLRQAERLGLTPAALGIAEG